MDAQPTFSRHGGAVTVFHARLERLKPHPEMTHTEHALTYLMDGWIEIEYGKPLRAEAGAMVLVPAGIPHRSIGGAGVELWSVGFCAACLQLDESQPLMSAFGRVRRGAMPVVPIAADRKRRVLQHFEVLSEECERGAPESHELMRSAVVMLLGELRRAEPSGESVVPGGSWVADALGFIQRRGLEPISLRDVAAAVHRTPSHVATTIKRVTGHSVGDWITSAKVSEAAAWLLHSDESLDEITARVGWQDKTHFIRQFRKAYGETPAAWRRRRRLEQSA